MRTNPGVFKVDWILDGPTPWKAMGCLGAGALHLGGTLEEIESAEEEVQIGTHPKRPFVLLAQPTLFDRTRTVGKNHIAWSYSHVPIQRPDHRPEGDVSR